VGSWVLGELVGTLALGVGVAGRALELGLGAGVDGIAACGAAGAEQPTTRAAVSPARTVTTTATGFDTLKALFLSYRRCWTRMGLSRRSDALTSFAEA
jgi:hypothetical protein